MSRASHGLMRRALYQPASVAAQHNPLVNSLGKRLRAGGLPPKFVLGACMQKLVLLIYGVLRSRQPSDVCRRARGLHRQDGI
jgi:transposase